MWILARGAELQRPLLSWEPNPDEIDRLIATVAEAGAQARVLFRMTTAQHRSLCGSCPGLAALPVVRVPPIHDRDLLYLWACRLPTWGRSAPSLPDLLRRLSALDEAAMRSPGDPPPAADVGGPWSWWIRRGARGDIDGLARRWGRGGPIPTLIDAYLGGPEAWAAFVPVAQILAGAPGG